jgi:hypothetical protein
VLEDLAQQERVLHDALDGLEEQHADRHHAARTQLRAGKRENAVVQYFRIPLVLNTESATGQNEQRP